MSLPCVCTWAPVLPEAFTRDKMIEVASFMSAAVGGAAAQGGGLHAQLGAAGQVKPEADLEVLVPLGRIEQVSAEDGQEHDHDERHERREGPSRVRAALRWGCHFSAFLGASLPVKPTAQNALSVLVLAWSPLRDPGSPAPAPWSMALSSASDGSLSSA